MDRHLLTFEIWLHRPFRLIENTRWKQTKAELDLQYLNSCKAYEVVPEFLKFKLYRQSLTTNESYKDFKMKLLDDEIGSKQRLAINLKQTLLTLNEQLNAIVSRMDFEALTHFLDGRMNRYRDKIEALQQRKTTKSRSPLASDFLQAR